MQVWRDAAASEARMNSLEALNKKKLGLREVQQFCLGLRHGFKSNKMQKGNGRPVECVVEAVMKVKIRDEKYNWRELEKRKDDLKKCLDGSEFLVYGGSVSEVNDLPDNSTMLVFCSSHAKERLRMSRTWLCDGTFKSAPSPFAQVFILIIIVIIIIITITNIIITIIIINIIISIKITS